MRKSDASQSGENLAKKSSGPRRRLRGQERTASELARLVPKRKRNGQLETVAEQNARLDREMLRQRLYRQAKHSVHDSQEIDPRTTYDEARSATNKFGMHTEANADNDSDEEAGFLDELSEEFALFLMKRFVSRSIQGEKRSASGYDTSRQKKRFKFF